jgi:predicted nucleic acid-binding protein
MKVVDTTVAVDHLRGLAPATRLLTELVTAGETLAASEITKFELLAGARQAELDALETFFSALAWVPIDEGISRTAGALAQGPRRSHRGIDDADHLIAATALVLEADLLTTNVRHFPTFKGLRAPY